MKPYSEKITFASSAGDLLAASLELPVAPPRAYAIFAHCFTCSKDYVAASWIAKSLAAEEIAVLRFDFTGLGNSQGDFANTNFSSNVEDLLAAATFLRENYSAPEILVGHSLGGTASIVAASKLPDVKAVATINAPHSPAHLKRHLQAAESEINARGEAIVNLAGRPFKIKKQFLDDISSHNMDEILRSLSKPLMIFHSPVDKIVGIDSAAKLFTTARHPKSFISLDSADHLLTNKADADFVGRTLAAWALRYVGGKRNS
ncbi:MAG: alpha/beta hydrolase [Candidatus Zixiibacteriota bacterium]